FTKPPPTTSWRPSWPRWTPSGPAPSLSSEELRPRRRGGSPAGGGPGPSRPAATAPGSRSREKVALELTTLADDEAVLFDGTRVVRLDGLRPDTDHDHEGVEFRTLPLPPGDLLAVVATVNDL